MRLIILTLLFGFQSAYGALSVISPAGDTQVSVQEPKKLEVIEDGISIQEPGIFTEGCYYGKAESLSDHAPVLYGNFGTWNTAGPISHFMIQPDPEKPAAYFFNHKFFTDKEGNLINRSGGKIGFLGSSEVALFKKGANTPESIRQFIYKGE
ncbi:MAG TPA: hypothetical protein VEL47_00860, partial [Myxococcota bacterium]|nr:hypothetical protein [Myxococcota bacterium]